MADTISVDIRVILLVVMAAGAGSAGGQIPRPAVPPRASQLTMPTGLDNFFYVIAINFDAPAVCQKINPSADGDGGGMSPRGYQIETLRTECYRGLANHLRDARLCDEVIPVRTDILDGSKFDKAGCLAALNGDRAIAVPDLNPTDPFVHLMNAVGFDDRRVAEYLYDANPANSRTHDAYKELRGDHTFLERVQAAQSYSEPRAEARIRIANAAEFLYEMIAVDSGDPSLCVKVSPNATLIGPGRKTALLRSRCVVAIAYNTRNAALCEELPLAGAFPYVNNQYDSVEACRSLVAIYSRPDFNSGGVHDGPSFFPHAADFEEALRQIGYPDPTARSRQATPDDYWEVLSRLSREGSVDERDDVLRRVMRLQ